MVCVLGTEEGRMARLQRTALLLAGCMIVVAFVGVVQTAADDEVDSLLDVIAIRDQLRMLKALAGPYDDFETTYLVAAGTEAIASSLPPDNTQTILQSTCTYASYRIPDTLEDVFYKASIFNVFGGLCKMEFSDAERKLVSSAMEGELNVETLYKAITAMATIGMKIDNKTVPQALVSAVENDDSPYSYARAFLAASLIPDADLSVLFDQIEDIIAQADETPTTLYYDGGLKVTSAVIRGVFALASRVGTAPALTLSQATKFGNTLVSSKYTTTLADTVHVLTAAKSLASNKYVVPSAVMVGSKKFISQNNKKLVVKLTNILEGSVGPFTVNLKSVEDPKNTEIVKNKPMTAASNSLSYTYPLYGEVSNPGVHRVTVSTQPKDKSSPAGGLPSIELMVTASFQVTVSAAKLSLVDKDQGVTSKAVTLDYPNKSKEMFEADQHTKVLMTFTLTNQKNSNTVTAHQVFVRLTSAGGQEIFFVATVGANEQYLFELDLVESAADFGRQSGTYGMTLVIGDFALENPFTWDFGSVTLKFPGTTEDKKEDDTYKPKPAIEHMFREPEKRPPKTVSFAFTVLVLLPLGMLLIMWLILGANISNITAGGLWTILFHIGLGGILGLYYCFWQQLNMFQTLKYLVGIGIFTFITGNRMLRNIAKSKQA